MASIADLYVDAGTNYSTVVNVSGDDGFQLDLTASTVKAQLRRHNYSANAIDFNVSLGELGEIILELDSTKTAMLKNSRYLYDVIITDANGVVSRIIEGIVFVNPRVTVNA